MIEDVNGQKVFVKKVMRNGTLSARQEAEIAFIYSKTIGTSRAIVEVYNQNNDLIGKYGCYKFTHDRGRWFYDVIEIFFDQEAEYYDIKFFKDVIANNIENRL